MQCSRWLLLGLVATLTMACGKKSSSSSSPPACVPTREFFAQQVWGPFMATTCFKCHAPDGVAAQQNAKFLLQGSSYPSFLDVNLANIQEITKIQYQGTTEILLKPLGQMNHGGGAVLTADSPQYAALKELVSRLQNGDSCPDKPPQLSLNNVTLLDPAATFRKAALSLVGRLPTDTERSTLAGGGEAALDAALDQLMTEDGFYVRLREAFNDVFLTDKYQWQGHGWPTAINLLNKTDYPIADMLRQEWSTNQWSDLSDADKQKLNDSIGREPLNLVAYVVQNNRPFTEILTANYALVDDYSAKVYNIQDGGSGLRQAQVRTASGVSIPHAGLLTTPVFLNRWTTTPTNRSRGRTRFLLKNFLATDILQVSQRPIDVATASQVENPTMNDQTCTVCHHIVDPMAGGFRGWDESDYEHFDPAAQWHDDMFAPGYGGQMLPSQDYGSAIQWLAQQMAQDPRFNVAAVRFAYTLVTGRDVLPYPADGDPNFAQELQAWEAQDAFLRDAISKFTAQNQNFKVLIKAIVESPYYRAAAQTGLTPAQQVQLDALGTQHLLTPEMLNRKIVATTGVHWRQMWGWDKPPNDWLLDPNTMLTYGGIDSDQITVRISQMSTVMNNLALRMANEHACIAAPYDFSLSQDQRVLFPKVRIIDVPESAGFPVDGSIQAIKANLVYLFDRLLGQTVTPDDPEVTAAYQLFLDTWHEGTAMGGAASNSLSWPCGASPIDGTALPSSITKDPQYVVRSWMAVLTYMLSDPQFLYE